MNDQIRTLTNDELIERLQAFPSGTQVVFACDYGDHCHTMQVVGVTDVSTSRVRESAYSQSGYALPGEHTNPDRLSAEEIIVIQ